MFFLVVLAISHTHARTIIQLSVCIEVEIWRWALILNKRSNSMIGWKTINRLLLRVCCWENIVSIWENIVWHWDDLVLHCCPSHPNHPNSYNDIIHVELAEIVVYSSNEYFPKDSLDDELARHAMPIINHQSCQQILLTGKWFSWSVSSAFVPMNSMNARRILRQRRSLFRVIDIVTKETKDVSFGWISRQLIGIYCTYFSSLLLILAICFFDLLSMRDFLC